MLFISISRKPATKKRLRQGSSALHELQRIQKWAIVGDLPVRRMALRGKITNLSTFMQQNRAEAIEIIEDMMTGSQRLLQAHLPDFYRTFKVKTEFDKRLRQAKQSSDPRLLMEYYSTMRTIEAMGKIAAKRSLTSDELGVLHRLLIRLETINHQYTNE